MNSGSQHVPATTPQHHVDLAGFQDAVLAQCSHLLPPETSQALLIQFVRHRHRADEFLPAFKKIRKKTSILRHLYRIADKRGRVPFLLHLTHVVLGKMNDALSAGKTGQGVLLAMPLIAGTWLLHAIGIRRIDAGDIRMTVARATARQDFIVSSLGNAGMTAPAFHQVRLAIKDLLAIGWIIDRTDSAHCNGATLFEKIDTINSAMGQMHDEAVMRSHHGEQYAAIGIPTDGEFFVTVRMTVASIDFTMR